MDYEKRFWKTDRFREPKNLGSYEAWKSNSGFTSHLKYSVLFGILPPLVVSLLTVINVRIDYNIFILIMFISATAGFLYLIFSPLVANTEKLKNE